MMPFSIHLFSHWSSHWAIPFSALPEPEMRTKSLDMLRKNYIFRHGGLGLGKGNQLIAQDGAGRILFSEKSLQTRGSHHRQFCLSGNK
jgi:hypothetical protein